MKFRRKNAGHPFGGRLPEISRRRRNNWLGTSKWLFLTVYVRIIIAPIRESRDREYIDSSNVRGRVPMRPSVRFRARNEYAAPVRLNRALGRRRTLAALIATKVGDVVTTAFGLLFVSGVAERNPVIARLAAAFGVVPALVLLSLASLGLVVACTEAGVTTLRRAEAPKWTEAATRGVGYGLPSTVFALATLNNAVVLLVASA
jgi:hypothetical protein